MSSEQLELSDATLRQRRNLIVTSVIIIFIHYADVKFGSEQKLQGFSITLGNVDAINLFLNVALIYFLWRFYQYFSADKAFSMLRGQFTNTLTERLDRKVTEKIFEARPEIKSLGGDFSYRHLKKISNKEYLITPTTYVPKEGYSGVNEEVPLEVILPKNSIEFTRLPAVVAFAFRGKILTDFYIPYVFTLCALIIQFL